MSGTTGGGWRCPARCPPASNGGPDGSLCGMEDPAPQTDRLGRVALATAIVAVADMADAVIVWVVIFQQSTVQRIFQSVASGLLGPASFSGGWATAALGLVLHVCVALGWTLLFLFLLERWSRLRAWVQTSGGAIAVGLAYGAVVWLLMDSIVLPLSRARVTPPTAPWFWIQLLTHPVVVGLPIVWIVSGAAQRTRRRVASRLHGPGPAAEM